MSTITKSFTKATPKEVEDNGNSAFINWASLTPYIGQIIKKKDDQVVQGLMASETGIIVKLAPPDKAVAATGS